MRADVHTSEYYTYMYTSTIHSYTSRRHGQTFDVERSVQPLSELASLISMHGAAALYLHVCTTY